MQESLYEQDDVPLLSKMVLSIVSAVRSVMDAVAATAATSASSRNRATRCIVRRETQAKQMK